MLHSSRAKDCLLCDVFYFLLSTSLMIEFVIKITLKIAAHRLLGWNARQTSGIAGPKQAYEL